MVNYQNLIIFDKTFCSIGFLNKFWENTNIFESIRIIIIKLISFRTQNILKF